MRNDSYAGNSRGVFSLFVSGFKGGCIVKKYDEPIVLSKKDKQHLFLNNIAYAIHQTLLPDKSWQEEKNKQRFIKAAEAAIVAIHHQPPVLADVTIDDWRKK